MRPTWCAKVSCAPPRSRADYDAACASLKLAGDRIRDYGLPAEHAPVVIGIPGTGNVSRGVQDAFHQLGGDVATMVQPHEVRGRPGAEEAP